ncbi:hypothetical protein ACF0H5_007525 [Mactra antiquata]
MMECVQSSSGRARRRQRRQHQDNVLDENREAEHKGSSIDVNERTGNTVGINNDKESIKALIDTLTEQEETAKNEKLKLERQSSLYKDKVTNFFDSLRDILKLKENELLENIDEEVDKNLEIVNGIVGDIGVEKRRLEHLGEYGCIEDENEVKSYIEQCRSERDDALKQLSSPELNIHEGTKETVKNLNFCEVSSSRTDSASNEVSESPNDNPEYNENLTELNEDADDENYVNDEVTDDGDDDIAITDDVYDDDDYLEEFGIANELEGASGFTEASHVTPSAPLLPENTEDPPPPYWQAVGLNQPQEFSERPPAEIPGYHDITHTNRLPENFLEFWHSFPVRRERDHRSPFIVALTWNFGRVCLTDRANMKVKFFVPQGHLLKAMQFLGNELHDITFLEEVQGEVRYLLSCPRNRNLFIISIDHTNNAQIVRKVDTDGCYSCVCRGPIEQTLIGIQLANRQYPNLFTAVHVFTFSGKILTQITHTPSAVLLMYPKAVEVFETKIIVLDWKLNSVCVYFQNGQQIGEYRGTPESPLVNPLDMTLDHKGNIMILNGEFSNIHVIDLNCNPLEVIKIPKNNPGSSTAKLIAFDVETHRLCLARSKGDLAVFTFQDGYETLNQRNLPPRRVLQEPQLPVRREPDVLPLVEGMLPSTIESIVSRQSNRNRNRQFHL